MSNKRLLGVTVMPEYFQTEGVEAVMDRLAQAGVNAIATSPYVMEAADEKTGSREPPDDAGAGKVRLLDRPLWGKRELFVRTAPSFAFNPALYRGLRYQPAAASPLTRRSGKLIHDAIRAAQSRHCKVYLQVQAAIPPGYRVQFGGPVEADRARLPDGRIPPRRLAANGSLASPEIVRYTQALLRDLCRVYPDINGLRVDWPEYPPYLLDDIFLDFSDHAQAAAARLGFDFEAMRREAAGLYSLLHGGLSNRHLEAWGEPGMGRYRLLRLLAGRPALLDWLRFKSVLVEELISGFRKAMDEAGGRRLELMPNAFPPPWSLASGMDYSRAARFSSAISVKLYTMHWPMMLRFYADALMQANPSLDNAKLASALEAWFDLDSGRAPAAATAYHYPETEEPHPAGDEAMARKIREAQAEAGSTPVYALAHGYGPLDDFRRRLRVAWQASSHGVWINRYGYLSDAKLGAIREATS